MEINVTTAQSITLLEEVVNGMFLWIVDQLDGFGDGWMDGSGQRWESLQWEPLAAATLLPDLNDFIQESEQHHW